MNFTAKVKYLRYSPYKLRPIVDVLRGKNVDYAINWLTTYKTQRALPVQKIIESAAANAKFQQSDLELRDLFIKEILVDQGPMYKYFKPGAMGRANPYKKRSSHISVVLESKK